MWEESRGVEGTWLCVHGKLQIWVKKTLRSILCSWIGRTGEGGEQPTTQIVHAWKLTESVTPVLGVCQISFLKSTSPTSAWELLKQDSFRSSGESDPIRNAAGRACGCATNIRGWQGIPESEVRPRSTVDRGWLKAPSVGRDPGERAKKGKNWRPRKLAPSVF